MYDTDTDSPFSGVQRPRPLPVVVLADASGSMGQDNKIETLNAAIETMVRTLAVEESSTAEVTLAVIAFSHTGAGVHLAPTPISEVKWGKLGAGGRTPMGEAFALLAELLGDETFLPRDAYLPTLVLVSDGKPTDPWEQQLRQLLDTKAGQALRLAVSIGSDADAESQRVLAAFVANPAYPVVRAEEVEKLSVFFRGVTRTISTRVRSTRPDDLSALDVEDLRGLVD